MPKKMVDISQLPFLVKLLDDESESVRMEVYQQLKQYGSSLERAFDLIDFPLNEFQERILRELIDIQSQESLLKTWPYWFEVNNDYRKLEMAMVFLSRFQQGGAPERDISDLLDALAEEFRASYPNQDIFNLIDFLFIQKKYKGAEQIDYYASCHSDLYSVITRQVGIPISLVVLFMLVADRLGLRVEGVNYPKHFLAKHEVEGHDLYIDCFDQGKILTAKELYGEDTFDVKSKIDIVQDTCDSETIVSRVLNNLIRGFHEEERASEVRFVEKLKKILQDRFS